MGAIFKVCRCNIFDNVTKSIKVYKICIVSAVGMTVVRTLRVDRFRYEFLYRSKNNKTSLRTVIMIV